MKKLFISCPMKGGTEENINKSMEKMHRIAEAVFDENLEVIESYIPDCEPDTLSNRIRRLGESIKMMADADYFIGVNNNPIYKDCVIEEMVAKQYFIESYTVSIDLIADDLSIFTQNER